MYNCKCRRCCKNNVYDSMCRQNCCCNNTVNAPIMDIDEDDCACGYDEVKSESVFPENPMLAQSYVPIQTMDKTFIPSVGLKMGTIFPELVSPYKPCQSLEDIAFIKAMNTVKEGCNKC